MHKTYRAVAALIVAALFYAIPSFGATSQSRISQAIDSRRMVRLSGEVHRLARPEFDEGALAPTHMVKGVTIFFQRSAAQQQDLDQLLQAQQDPKSANYHKWLTPEQYADRFGLSTTDIAKVQDWLTSQGLKIDAVANGRNWITFSGPVAQIQSAFQTELHQYNVNGTLHFANATNPAIPASLAGVVGGIRGLNDFRPKPRAVMHKPKAAFTSNISGNNYVAPDDFARIYGINALWANGTDGTGQKIAVAGQTDIKLSDITTFRTVAGLPTNTPQVVLVPGSSDPGLVTADLAEASLDVEWAGAVAKNATIIYVNSSNVFTSVNYAVDANLAPVISVSYGMCEPQMVDSDFAFIDSLGQQANAQGQTIVGPSGDSGAADCDYANTVTTATQGLAVDAPASSPYVTGVGGTTFNEGGGTYWSTTNNGAGGSALYYIPETSWNDTTASLGDANGFASTGGGVSSRYAKPSWQTGPGVPNDGKRDVPDISFAASHYHDGYIICSDGSCVNGFRNTDSTLDIVGGTSAGVPTFAGVVALLNQKMGARQGNVNARLYALAASTPYVFHDVTTGDNKVPCQAGAPDCPNGGSLGYSAATGYDMVTGLGTPDAYNLVSNWDANATPPTADFYVTFLDTSARTLTRGTSLSFPAVVQRRNGFSGTVTLSCAVSSGLTGTTCTVSPTTANPDGTVTVTIAATSTSAALRPPASMRPLWSLGFGAAAIVIGGIGSKRRKWALLIGLLLIVAMTMVACGGGGTTSTSSSNSNTTTTTQTGTVTVTATDGGTLQRSAQLSVTVQ